MKLADMNVGFAAMRQHGQKLEDHLVSPKTLIK